MALRFDRHGRKGVLHYVTFNIRDKRKAFSSEANARAACLALRQHCDEHPAKLIAYVVMPDHMHIIINPQDGNINRFLAQLKPAITQRVVEIANEQENKRVPCWLFDENLQRNRLWQDGKYNFHLLTPRLIWQKINYIHTNPIAKKLVQTAEDYPFSSYRGMYEIDKEIIIPLDKDFWWDELVLDDSEIKSEPGQIIYSISDQ